MFRMNKRTCFVYLSTNFCVKTPWHFFSPRSVGGRVKKISVVCCTDWALPTSLDRMSRRLSIASP